MLIRVPDVIVLEKTDLRSRIAVPVFSWANRNLNGRKAMPRGTGTGVPSRLVEEMKRGRPIVWAVASLLIPMALIVIASPARAYGNTAVWQLGVSVNCNNPDLCGEAAGGFWGWLEFDNDNTGDATLAGCG